VNRRDLSCEGQDMRLDSHPTVRDRRFRGRLSKLAVALVASVALGCTSVSPSNAPTPGSSGTDPAVTPSVAATDAPSGGVAATPTSSAAGDAPTPSASTSPAAGTTPTPLFAIRVPRASRVVVPALGIDLPVVSSDLQPPPDNYPLCDVAQYLTTFGQPGQDGTTYLYAHARPGMFGPLLQASLRADGAELIGVPVDVYTSDARVYRYRIFRVQRHATDYSATVVKPGERRLILQTSEGPYGTIPKLVVAAEPVSEGPADAAEATPQARPRDCRPDELLAPPTREPEPERPTASRVAIPALGIDLPVISGEVEVTGNPEGYPLCDVAQYLSRYGQPGDRVTYLYSHARAGMFLPLLEASGRDAGAELLGVEVHVYRSDGQRFTYRIDRVVPHATDTFVADHIAEGAQALVLQTSEGPRGTLPKLVLRAPFVRSEPVSEQEARPEARPRVCA
jgi:hypothetical protein